MSQYLRDEYLKNISLSEEALKELYEELLAIQVIENGKISNKMTDPHYVFLTCTIRFDNRGFRLFNMNDVLKYFRSAKNVERIAFNLFSSSYFTSNSLSGKSVSICFDGKDVNNCQLKVDDDDKSWVDSCFLRHQEIIGRYGNKNHWIRNSWTTFAVQIIGVALGFIFSLWTAVNFSPYLSLKYADGFTFVVAFILFSNIWTYLYAIILRTIDYLWPNISFKKQEGIYGLLKAILITFFTSATIFVFSWLMKIIYQFVSSLFI